MTIEKKELGAAIKQLRMTRGLSQAQLAKAAGLSQSGNSVALIERGERFVSIETLNALANALNVPPACLAILGSSRITGSEEAIDLMKSLQRLITVALKAQTELRTEEKAKDAKEARTQHQRVALTGKVKTFNAVQKDKADRPSKHATTPRQAKSKRKRRKVATA